MKNEQKTAIITGATSGTGYELAKLFAKDHYNPVIVSRNQDELESKVQEFKVNYGIEALMVGEDRVISGFKNKVQVHASNLLPDSAVAHQLHEQQYRSKNPKT